MEEAKRSGMNLSANSTGILSPEIGLWYALESCAHAATLAHAPAFASLPSQDAFPFDNQQLTVQVRVGYTVGREMNLGSSSHPAELKTGKLGAQELLKCEPNWRHVIADKERNKDKEGNELSDLENVARKHFGGDKFSSVGMDTNLDTKEWYFGADKRVEFTVVERSKEASRKNNNWRDAHFSVCTSRLCAPYLFNGGRTAPSCACVSVSGSCPPRRPSFLTTLSFLLPSLLHLVLPPSS